MHFYLVSAVDSLSFANIGQHYHGKHPNTGVSRNTFVSFLGRLHENICTEFLSNSEEYLLIMQRSNYGIESLRTKEMA
jgi:hypothetical protein